MLVTIMMGVGMMVEAITSRGYQVLVEVLMV